MSAAPAMTLEGVLGPNRRLDDAAAMAISDPAAICRAADGRLLVGSGAVVLALRRWDGELERVATFGAPVTALAAGVDGSIAVGLATGDVTVLAAEGIPTGGWPAPTGLATVADLTFISSTEIAVADNGYPMGDNPLTIAPWDDAARGKVVLLTRNGGQRTLADGLHCPMAVATTAVGIAVTEMERGRILDVAGRVLRAGLPGYLGRLRPIADGYALACLARRDPLIEFLKTEPGFVAEMKRNIEPAAWIAPRTNPDFSADLPITLGATRLFGEIKPWAPSFSYGLVIELDMNLWPVGSAHSRADGRRHGITDVCEWDGSLIVVSRSSGELLRIVR